MKRPVRWVLWLYPSAWRARYQAELEALVEDSQSGWGDLFDLLKGAVQMRVVECWTFAQLAIVLGLAGMLIAGIAAARLRPSWVSESELKLWSPAAGPDDASIARADGELTARFAQVQNEILSRTGLSRVIQDPRLGLYSEERKTQPLEDVIEKMRSQDIRINMERKPGSGIGLKISFRYPDRRKAQQTVMALVTGFEDSNSIMERNMRRLPATDWLDVLDPPSLPIASKFQMLFPWVPWNFVSHADLQMWVSQVENEDSAARARRTTERFAKLKDEVLSTQSLARLVRDPRLHLYPKKRQSRSLESLTERTREAIQVKLREPESFGPVIEISFRDPDRFKAQQTVQALVTGFAEADKRRRSQIAAMNSWSTMQIDVTNPPGTGLRVEPKWYLLLAIGLGSGVFVAALTRLVMMRSARAA